MEKRKIYIASIFMAIITFSMQNYALSAETPPVHDVAVTEVQLSKTLVGLWRCCPNSRVLYIAGLVSNLGDFDEVVNVTFYFRPSYELLWTKIGEINETEVIVTIHQDDDPSNNEFTLLLAFRRTLYGDATGDYEIDIYDIILICGRLGCSNRTFRYKP
jgi:hypothetical protein